MFMEQDKRQDRYYFILKQVGLKILYYRKSRNWTQDDLAERAFLSRTQLQRIETAKSPPSVIALIDIATALDIPVRALFDFDMLIK